MLIVLSVITIHAAKAQTEKGSQNLGATFGVSVTNSNTRYFNSFDNTITDNSRGKLTTYSIAPSYSYFIADKLDIGAAIGYSYNNQKYDPALNSQIQQRNESYSANIFLRKYFLFDNKIGIRTGPYLDYQKMKQRFAYTSNVDNYSSDSYGGGLSMDFVFYPAKNIGLAAALANLGYRHDKYTDDTLGDANSFQFNFVNSIAFSIYYVFGK